jgi:hypothetical protein
VTSGVRIGTPAMTTRGFKDEEARATAHLIADVLDNPHDEANIAAVRAKLRGADAPPLTPWYRGFAGAVARKGAERLADYNGPMYALFETEFGVRMVRAEEKIRAVLPDKAQRELLQLPPNTPLLSVERIAYTYNDTPMELRRGFYRTDTHHYHNDLN